MKRILISLSILVLATFAFAQHPMHGGPQAGPQGGSCDPTSFLNLTADQKTQWDAIHQQLRDAVEPLFDQKRAAEEQLRTLVDAASPDATAIGKQMLAVKAIDQQIKAAHDAAATKIEAILTADQKVRFEALRALHECHGGEPGPRS